MLARWDDDGWYYRGVLLTAGSTAGSYLVADATEGVANIWRENILTEAEDAEVSTEYWVGWLGVREVKAERVSGRKVEGFVIKSGEEK